MNHRAHTNLHCHISTYGSISVTWPGTRSVRSEPPGTHGAGVKATQGAVTPEVGSTVKEVGASPKLHLSIAFEQT